MMSAALYRKTSFMLSANQVNQCPADVGLEVAFVGRSNAGKSSALNAITDCKQLARISKTPGRTQLINFFSVDDERRLVDLPGYGYAKVSHRARAHWDSILAGYLQTRQSLQGLVLLMDCRHPLKETDMQLIEWSLEANLPVHAVLTKGDKLKRGALAKTLLEVKKQLSGRVSVQTFSAKSKDGLDGLHAKLDEWLQLD
jgi:GTP-binding protein